MPRRTLCTPLQAKLALGTDRAGHVVMEWLEQRLLLVVQLAVIVDGSDSIPVFIYPQVKEALLGAVAEIPTDGSIELTVVQFATGAGTVLPPTLINSPPARTAALNAIDSLVQPGGQTNFGLGQQLALDLVRASPRFEPQGIQYFNALTDGAWGGSASESLIDAGVDVLSFEAMHLGEFGEERMLAAAFPQPAVKLDADLTNFPDPYYSAGYFAHVVTIEQMQAVLERKFALLAAPCSAEGKVISRDGKQVLRITCCPEGSRLIVRESAGEITVLTGPEGSETVTGSFSIATFDEVEVFGSNNPDEIINEVEGLFSGPVRILGNGGDDTITSTRADGVMGFNVSLHGGDGNDELTTNGAFTRVFGEDGDDLLVGQANVQLIFGGEGNDTLLGNDGRDALYGEDDDDSLAGGPGGDFLHGGGGQNTLRGGDGNDTLEGGSFSDSLHGEDGVDLLSYVAVSRDITVDLLDEKGALEELATGFENVLGGLGDDLLRGNTRDNFLLGGPGNDTLRGLGGNDKLLGNDGFDVLDGGSGDDLLIDFDALLLGGGPDQFQGKSGFDLALADEQDEADDDVEGVYHTLEEFLIALAARGGE